LVFVRECEKFLKLCTNDISVGNNCTSWKEVCRLVDRVKEDGGMDVGDACCEQSWTVMNTLIDICWHCHA